MVIGCCLGQVHNSDRTGRVTDALLTSLGVPNLAVVAPTSHGDLLQLRQAFRFHLELQAGQATQSRPEQALATASFVAARNCSHVRRQPLSPLSCWLQ